MSTKNSDSSSRMNYLATALLLSIVALVLVRLSEISTVELGLTTVAPNGQFINWIGLVLLMAGLFPLSAIAFVWLEVPGIIQQVKKDCKLLNTESTLDNLPDKSVGRWNQSSYAVHYTLAIIATLLGVGLLFRDADKYLSINALQAMRFGFLGAYIYCLNLIYRRYTTLDLQPSVYLYCAVGLTAGMVFNYVAFKAIDSIAAVNSATVATDPALDGAKEALADVKAATADAMKAAADTKAAAAEVKKATTAVEATDANFKVEVDDKVTLAETAAKESEDMAKKADDKAAKAAQKVAAYAANKEFTGIGAAAAAILAFSLGYFPNLAIAWFGRLSYTAMNQGQRRSDALPLALIDGISELHETRLRDEGIDNIQNLATANIRDLVEKTPFSAQEIVEWVDQAVLYLYLDPSEIASFRRAGARSVTDFGDLWRGFCVRYEVQPDGTFKRQPIGQGAGIASEFDARRKAIAQQLQTTEERLDALYRATEIGPNMHYVRTYWDSVEALEARARVNLVRGVCGRVGCALRTSERDGVATDGANVLKQVVRLLLSAAKTTALNSVSDDNPAAALYGQAVLNQLLGDISEARRLYEECITTFPRDPTAFNDLAWMLLHASKDQSQYDSAFKHASTAVKLAKEDSTHSSALPGYLDTLALAHIQLKQPKKALELIHEAMKAWSKSNPERSQPKFLITLVSAADELVVQGSKPDAANVLYSVLNSGYADATTAARAQGSLQELLATLVKDAKTPPPGKKKEASDVLRWVLDSKYADEPTATLAKQLLGESEAS